MKKIRNLVLVLALFLCFNGCEKSPSEDSLLQNDAELTIEQAKSFVGQQSVNQFTLKSGNLQKTTVKIKVDWGKAKSSNNGKISVVETPILTLGGFGFATPEAVSAYETTQNVGYLNSVSKLVVLTYKKTGTIVSFIMTIVGNKSFMEKRKFTLLDQTYLTRDKELTGFVFYHSIDGKFVNGWQYVGGKVVGKIGMNDDDSPVLQLKSTYYINYYTTTCVTDSWVESGAGSGIYGFGSETTCTTTLHTNSYTIYDTNNNTTTIDWIQAEESGSTGVYVPEPAPMPAIELSTKFENNEKVMCIYSNLVRTAIKSFNPLVTSFLANFSDGVTINPGDIKFDLGSLDGAYGNSTQSGDMFTVMLNENEISTRAPLEIAKTLIHEILHAQIGHNLQITPNSFISNFRQYIETVNGVSDINDHQFMIANYVQPMMRFLKDYDSLNGYSASDDYYRSLALSGLEGIISTMEMNDLINAQNYFRNRGLNCQ
jgi:hypothetical protein